MSGQVDGDDDWAQRAAVRLQASLKGRARGLMRLPLWSSSRASYAEVPLPPGFTLETRQAGGAVRKVARAPGRGRPLLVVPGLYGSLHEALFVQLAAAANACGRPTWLLEDRFAWSTLQLNGGAPVRLAQLALELAEIAQSLPEPPDVVALSAGTAGALFVPDGCFHRLTAWSSAFDPAWVLPFAKRHRVVHWYFHRAHRRAYQRAGLPSPSWEDLVAGLGEAPEAGLLPSPLLLVHAEDDPAAPAERVRKLPLGPRQALCLLPHGGHLGFGALGGIGIYLDPLLDTGA